ncbi:MAG: NAD(P)-binding domain-containing protein [Sphingopyxis sp.]
MMLVYGLPLLAIWAAWIWLGRRKTRASLSVWDEAKQAGLTEPSSLHPVIDPAYCLGCAACVKACPEKSILGIVDGKAKLIEPSHCVGHGACATSCPTNAITLVFGTETRGVDIPFVSPKFETNVPGLFIAGELGGMGLIRNAIEQGRQAMDNIATKAKAAPKQAGVLDVLIVGAGPAGISASLGAKERKLNFCTIDQDSLGGTVAQFPRGKLVMTAPAELPLHGKVMFSEVSKEKLLQFWYDVVDKNALELNLEERVETIVREDELFRITTSRGDYRARFVLLAIGRRGSPRKLGVPGEEQNKVVYRMIDPAQYAGKRVLVVGGGDSAIEAATSIADEAGTTVTLSYRRDAFDRARSKNRERLADAQSSGRLVVELSSQVESISPDSVQLRTASGPKILPNDAVIVCVGGILPTQFLKDIGISVETKYGTV